MITANDLEKFIKQIPAAPVVVIETLKELEKEDLIKAAKSALRDPALISYLREIINKPYFGFTNDINDIYQIFSGLGIIRAKQIISSYLVSILAPKSWSFFELTQEDIQNMQSDTIIIWNKILDYKKCEESEIAISAVLLPAAIIVCEYLFRAKQEEIELILSNKYLDYNSLLERVSGRNFFDLVEIICQKWGLPIRSAKILKAASGNNPDACDYKDLVYAKMLHMLFFYLLVKPNLVKAGLMQFIEYNPDFTEDIAQEFIEIVGIKS